MALGTRPMEAIGTLLKRGDGADPEEFATVGQITNNPLPTMVMDTIDVTSHSTDDGWKDYIPSLKDGGEIALEMNLIQGDTTQGLLLTDFTNRTLSNYQVQLPTPEGGEAGEIFNFAAYVTACTPTAEIDGQLKLNVTLRTVGAITKTAATLES